MADFWRVRGHLPSLFIQGLQISGPDLPQFVSLKGAPYRMEQFLAFHISPHRIKQKPELCFPASSKCERFIIYSV